MPCAVGRKASQARIVVRGPGTRLRNFYGCEVKAETVVTCADVDLTLIGVAGLSTFIHFLLL